MEALRGAVEAAKPDPELVGRLAEAEAGGEPDDERAELLAAAAAVVFKAHDQLRARALLERAAELASPHLRRLFVAGTRDLYAFALLARAGWLVRRERVAEAHEAVEEAVRVAKAPEVREAAKKMLIGDRMEGDPVPRQPTLFTLFGFGLGVTGERDRRPDGTYVTNHSLWLARLPVWPLGAYRVRGGGQDVKFERRVSLSWAARAWRVLVVGLVVLAGFGFVRLRAARRVSALGQSVPAVVDEDAPLGDELGEVGQE